MKELNIGVIGTGHLGKLHTKMFKEIENCNLIGINDSNNEQAELAAKEFGVSVFNSLNDLLEKVDAVSIAATTSAHYDLAKICLDAGKHIFIEKPITATIPQAEEIVELADKFNLNLQVGHIERFNPALISMEKYISDPKFIQTDRLAQFNPRGTDVAVVLDLMIHDIDIILSLIKSKVKNIDASGVAVVSDNIDIANARIQFENGAVANVTASRISQKKMRKMRIFQRDGYVALDFVTGVSEVYSLLPVDQKVKEGFISFGEIGVGDKKKRLVYEQPEQKDINALKYELQLFVDSVLKKEKPVVTGRDGLRALRVAKIIIDKIETGIAELE
jgi:predicted dehydrogenase